MVSFNILAIAATILPFVGAAPAPATPPVQSVSASRAGTVVADNYIVLLKEGVSDKDFEAHQSWATSLHNRRLARRDDESLSGIKRRYNFGSLTGYSGAFDSATIEEIKARDDVQLVEEDKIMIAFELESQSPVPSWGLSRVSEKVLGSLDTYTYDTSAGSGITAYVVDTGVSVDHSDFGGRATFGHNAVGDGEDSDGQGHGTHVAGTIGGEKYGLAKKVNIVAVKVLGSDGSGSTSGVIAGVEWVASDAKTKGKSGKSVANMSLGGGMSVALNKAVEAAIESGVTFCVAAGNDGANAASYSPASVPSAITVGATDKTDARAVYSNFGELVDVFAPGTNITSAWIGGNDAERTISGTSMATPHVVGLAVYLIALEGLEGAEQVGARIKELAVTGIVSNPGTSTTDALVFNGAAQNNGTLDKYMRRHKKF